MIDLSQNLTINIPLTQWDLRLVEKLHFPYNWCASGFSSTGWVDVAGPATAFLATFDRHCSRFLTECPYEFLRTNSQESSLRMFAPSRPTCLLKSCVIGWVSPRLPEGPSVGDSRHLATNSEPQSFGLSWAFLNCFCCSCLTMLCFTGNMQGCLKLGTAPEI